MPRVRTQKVTVHVQNHRHDNEQRNTDTTAITAPPPFREHDDIFVLNNKVSHPAKFIEYVRSDDTARDCIFAIVRYNTSSSVAQVPVRLLQLMRNTSRLRSSTKSNHSTNTVENDIRFYNKLHIRMVDFIFN